MTAIVVSALSLLGALLGIFVQASTVLFVVINVLVAVTPAGVTFYLLRPDASAGLTPLIARVSCLGRTSALPSVS